MQLIRLFQDNAFITELDQVNTSEGLQALLVCHGLELNTDAVDALLQGLAVGQQNSDDLSEAELEHVAGGVAVEWIFTTAISFSKDICKKAC